MRTGRAAFTLIELLVVIAIIAILISILLPVLASARESGRTAQCLANERSLGQGLAAYTNTYDEWLPGPNTSGRRLHQGRPYEEGASTPLQDWDWISPIVGDLLKLPTERLSKYQEIMQSAMSCPANRETYATNFTERSGLVPMDRERPGEGPHPLIMSYTVSPLFLLEANYGLPRNGWKDPSEGEFMRLWNRGGAVRPATGGGAQAQMMLPIGYKPRIHQLGNPSRKALAFEGGRYFVSSYNNGRGGLDYSTATNTTGLEGSPQGNFTSIGPYFVNIAPSGMGGLRRETNGKPSRFMSEVFLRHPGDAMNIGFFDGSAQTMNQDKIADPSIYAPRKSVIVGQQLVWRDRYTVDREIE